MTGESEFRASPLALAVLSLLHAAPLHPYAMQRLLKLWGKDKVINVGQRANLYKTIRRLDQAGLIAVRQTERDQQYPERTVYELTEPGRLASHEWLTDMLARPRNEFPQFPAALSFMMLLAPDEARAVLEQRTAVLRGQLAEIEADLQTYAGIMPRVVLMDDEYQRAMISAELAWAEGIAADLRKGVGLEPRRVRGRGRCVPAGGRDGQRIAGQQYSLGPVVTRPYREARASARYRCSFVTKPRSSRLPSRISFSVAALASAAAPSRSACSMSSALSQNTSDSISRTTYSTSYSRTRSAEGHCW